MFSIASKSRAAVGFFLFLSLILTVFLLSGATQSSPAIRNIYLLKLHYTGPNSNHHTLTPVIPKITDISNPKTDTNNNPITTGTYSRKIPKPTPSSTTTRKPTSKQTVTPTLRQRDLNATPAPAIDPLGHRPAELSTPHNYHTHSRRQVIVPQPRPLSDEQTLREIISLKDVDLDVFFGYYGICVGGETIPIRCTNKRPKSAQSLKMSLFPGEYNQDGSVNTTILTLEKDPQDILSLGLQLQQAISPVPVIGAVIAFGIAWLISLYISFSSGTSYSGVGGAENIRLDKITFGIATLGLLLLLTAVSFLKVAGDVAYEILTGQSGEDSNGFLLEVAGVDATPGYHALRIGIAALIMVAGVVGGMAWCMGIGRRIETNGAGYGHDSGMFGAVGGLFGRIMEGRRRRGEQIHDGPQWKMNIGKPVPGFAHQMQGYPVQQHPQKHMHPVFVGHGGREANYV